MIELSELIGFGYDLSDTQDGLKCLRIGFIFCGEQTILVTSIQVSDPGPKGPLSYVWSSFCCALLNVVSSFAIISLGKRELVALLLLPFNVI